MRAPFAACLSACLSTCLAACVAGDAPADPAPYEGAAAGDCTDGADNDRDGYFDCADNGCWNAPDCEGEGGGTGDGSDGADLLAFYQLADCQSTYTGAGDQAAADGDRVTFQGTWALASST